MTEKLCVICNEALQGKPTREVKAKGIATLIDASLKRKDKKRAQIIGKKSIITHEACYKHYTNPGIIKTYTQHAGASSSPACTRSSLASNFDFNSCLFCAHDTSDKFIKDQLKKNTERRRAVRFINTVKTVEKILKHSCDRNDKMANDVLDRIHSVPSLLTVEARYHLSCYTKYFHSSQLPIDQSINDTPRIIEIIEKYISENPNERHFSMKKIIEGYEVNVPNNQWLKRQLYEKLGDDIFITSNPGVAPIIYLRDTCHKVLLKHSADSELQEGEREKIVKAAAKIITDDIRSREYETDHYPSPNSFLENVETDVPGSLRTFLDLIISSNKRGREERLSSKIVSIAHAIISCVRPRSFLSCLQIGLGTMLNKKFGSKILINILSALGFCCSYDDSLLFEASVLSHPSDCNIDSKSFSQFVFDNADHNINTIDGLHTFHAMGGIECVIPTSAVTCGSKIPKLRKIPSAHTVGTFGTVDLKIFHGYKKTGLLNVVVQNLNEKNPTVTYDFDISSTDFLWLYNYKVRCFDIKGWNGFMQQLTTDKHYVKSRIIFLPFINHPPGNVDTIYTSLKMAVERMRSKEQTVTFFTADLPIYMKVKEILHCSEDPDLKSIVPRLGGFHLLMSELGTIGNVMDGSGLKELFSEIYAPSSVDKMLQGSAYSRAVRAHTLTHCALANIIMSSIEFAEEEKLKLRVVLENPEDIFENIDNDVEFKRIKNKFVETVEAFSQRSGTAKLWIQYFHMVSVTKMFIEAERSGNWQLHLQSIQRMLPFFHATGHFLYAKAAHLYLQDMYDLKYKIDALEYERFVNDGYFTIRRTDKFWSGIWSDMTVEQTLMRSIKDVGGPTRGRGMNESVLSKWVIGTPALLDLTESITEFCNVYLTTTEQHVDARPTRIARDDADVKKLLTWFETHDPFPESEGLISLSSGLKSDGTINCHEALEVGLRCLNEMWTATEDEPPKTVKDMKFKRKNNVKTLKSLVSSIKISDKQKLTIDPSLIFQRICVLKKSDEELQEFLNYELAPYPLSLFDDKGMRKGQKSKLYDFYKPIEAPKKSSNDLHVIDGGFLLHKVVWQKDETFDSILTKYINYLKNNYSKSCTVVFDGYPNNADGKYIKSAERLRRSRINFAPEVMCEVHLSAELSQEKFLSNEKNKDHFIDILSKRLRDEGFGVEQAPEDADYDIVNTALSASSRYDSIFIVGEDVDLVVILTQNGRSADNVYMLKPSRGRIEEKIYSPNSFIHPEIKHLIGFIHAFTGCDTTSALYKQGKAKLIKLLKTHHQLREQAEIFNNPYASRNLIQSAGRDIISVLYGGKCDDTRTYEELRYLCFTKSTLRSTFNLNSLPPTFEAANEHALRVYLQVSEWRGDKSKDAMQWGWKKTNNALTPITSRKDPIPANLLKIISCGCDKGNCSSNCTCKKLGLHCTILCKKCHGETCENVVEKDVILSDDEIENDIVRMTGMIESNEDINYDLTTNNDRDDEKIYDSGSDQTDIEIECENDSPECSRPKRTKVA